MTETDAILQDYELGLERKMLTWDQISTEVETGVYLYNPLYY